MNTQLSFHWMAAAKKGDFGEIQRLVEEQAADVNAGPEVQDCGRRLHEEQSV